VGKRITIEHLEIHNFKGIRRLKIDFQGRDARISGRNQAGKSTVFDAVLWLLFGRDSRNAAKFDVKPTNGFGQPVVGSEPTVIAALNIDGQTKVLQRALLEVWTTPKGQAEKVYTSDRGAYWIDDVPKSEGDYNRFVSSILPEAQFRLITNPDEFMAKDTREKRLVLLGIADNGVDAVMAERFPELVKALDGLSSDDARKKFKTQKAKTDEELSGIPSRLDEQNRLLEGADVNDRKGFQDTADRLTKEITDVNVQLSQDPKAALRADLKRAEREVLDVEDAAKKAHAGKRSTALNRSLDASNALKKVRRIVEDLEALVPKQREIFDATAKKMDELRAEYSEVYESKFVVPSDIRDTCPTCGQSLPPDQVADAVQKAAEVFTKKKLARLDQIDADGKAKGLSNGSLGGQIETNEKELEAAKVKLAEAEAEQKEAAQAFDTIDAAGVTYPEDLALLKAARDEIKKQVDAPEGEQVAALRARLKALEGELAEAQRGVASCDVVAKAKDRIAELEATRRTLGDRAVELNQRLQAVEEYVRERCRLLEESINAKFPSVRWRLFEELKGDGFRDVCTCLVPSDEGALVPYASANTGGRVNAGMEIINVLAEAYGVAAPVFVENAESVDQITQTTGQQIALFKPDPAFCVWKGLKIEFSDRGEA
jgi:hypothetical protein